MKFKATGAKLLTNIYVLHTVFVIAFLNIMCFVIFGKLDALILFVLISIIMGNFSRNMILVLGVPVVFVNLFLLKETCFPINTYEGFEYGDSDNKSNKAIARKKSKSSNNRGKKMKAISNNNTESFKENSNTKNNNSKNKPKIDYASTVEEAYDNLNNMIGSEGIQNLTKDTQKLVNQQSHLAEAMKSMAPMIENMGPLLDRAKGILGDGGMEGIANMAKKMTKKMTKDE
jgi:hypothetical protein